MSDWQVGDKAVFVKCECGGGHSRPTTRKMSLGAIYTVAGVRSGPFPSCRAPYALYLAEVPENRLGVCGARFRRLRPDAHEECEEEFTKLVRRKSAPSPQEREKRILEALFNSTRGRGAAEKAAPVSK